MPQRDAQEVLADEILQDARKRAERILARGRADAERVVADAQAAARAEADRIIGEARQRAEKRREMLLRSVGQEVSRRKLQAREGVVERVLEQAREQLHQLSGEAYRQAALRVALAALRRMPGEELLVQVSAPAGHNLDAASLGSELERLVGGEGKKVRLRVELSLDLPRGVRVRSADGRRLWDNTFDARLRRLRVGLRRLIVPILFGEA
jgi:V/A-type H+-transporting ATPase subunit E